MAGGPLGVVAAPACAAAECALRHGAGASASARAAAPLQAAGRPPRLLTLPASSRRLRASHAWCGSTAAPCCVAATAPPSSDGGDGGSRAASPAAASIVVSWHGAGRPQLAAPAAVRAARRGAARASTSGAASSAAPAGLGASGVAPASRGGVACASASSSAAAAAVASAAPYAPLSADADAAAAERFALDSLRLGFSYGAAAARHAPRCGCPNCNTRRTRLREEFPELVSALPQGDDGDVASGRPGVRGGSRAAAAAGAAAAASDADGFAYAGGTRHAAACACPRCNSRRAALAAEAAAAASAAGAGEPAAGAASAAAAVGAAAGAAAAAAAAPQHPATPTPAADAPELLVCSDGGFVVGAVAPARHPAGCACPNCNRVRSRLRSGAAVARHLTAAATDAVPVSATFSAPPEEQAAKEALRRARIAQANAGRTPWNAGRRHSAATIAKITAATRVAMASPSMRARLSAAATASRHTDVTRAKISAGIRAYLDKRRIAAAAVFVAALVYNPRWAVALPGATWLGTPLTRRLAAQSSASLPPPPEPEAPPEAAAASTPGRKRASEAAAPKAWDPNRSTASYKSPQHRARIAESIRAKWRDVAYADRVVNSMRVVGAARARAAPSYASSTPRTRRRSDDGAASDDDGGGASDGAGRRVLTSEEVTRRAAMEAGARDMLAQAAAAAAELRARADAGEPVDDATLAEVNDAVAKATAVLERVGARNAADAAAAARQALPSPAAKRGPGAGVSPAAAAAARRATPPARRRAAARPGEGAREMVWRQGRLVDASSDEEEE
jgi:hypothetical protein